MHIHLYKTHPQSRFTFYKLQQLQLEIYQVMIISCHTNPLLLRLQPLQLAHLVSRFASNTRVIADASFESTGFSHVK